jgi:hypothetical protein
MADQKINVKLDSNNVPNATPNQKKLHRDDTVQWTCKDGNLRIIFAHSPFTSGALILDGPGGTTGKETIATPKFKYTAEVTTPGGKVFSKDPDLIIEDSGGGPGEKGKTPKKETPKKKTPKKKAKK